MIETEEKQDIREYIIETEQKQNRNRIEQIIEQ